MISGVLSITIILIVFYHGINILSNRGVSGEIIGSILGYHYNTLGSFYIILGPLIIVLAIRKRFWGVINWCLALIAVGFLQSRTALFVFLFGNIMMLFFLGKKKELILLSSLFLISSLYFLPEFLHKTLLIGLDENLDSIFSGRIDSIWLPLLIEWLNNIKLFLFGKGMFAMMTSRQFQMGIMYQTGHSHNALLGLFIDNGIFIFSGVIFIISRLLILAWHNVKRINSDIGWALLMSIICYFISTISGRTFYPTPDTMFLFPIIAILVIFLQLNIDILKSNEPIRQNDTRP